jgi:nucleoside-diphosphate-sugar epimerase
MKVLVIGSEGNVGVPLVRYLRQIGHDVRESDIRQRWRDSYLTADITQAIDLLPLFDWQPDCVILLAAVVSRLTCELSPSVSVSTNLVGLNDVIQLCKRGGAKLIFFSTSEIYGPQHDPMDEAIPNPLPNNRYGLLKWLGEQMVEYEVRSCGLKAVTLRPFMMYDESEDLGDSRSAVMKFAGRLATGRAIEVHEGSARGWFHVSDAVQAIAASMALEEYVVINIGNPEIVPIATVAEMIRKRLNAPAQLVTTVPQPPKTTQIKRPTLQRQKTLLKFEPRVCLAEGLDLVCREIQRRLPEAESMFREVPKAILTEKAR